MDSLNSEQHFICISGKAETLLCNFQGDMTLSVVYFILGEIQNYLQCAK